MNEVTIDRKYTVVGDRRASSSDNPVYVFDLDGTIADITHRLHFIDSRPKDWNGFFSAVKDDEPKEWVIEIMRLLPPDDILIFSGRSSICSEDTVEWLEKNNVPYAELRMRWHHNFERDEVLKPRMAKHYWDRIRFIMDDRQRVVDMWRRKGFNVLQVDKWDEPSLEEVSKGGDK